MQNIAEYKIVRGSRSTVESMVDGYLKNGWQLYGTPFVYPDGDTAQGIVLPEEDDSADGL